MTVPNRRFALLEGYETLTEKESLCIREGNFGEIASVQQKKANLLKALQSLEDASDLSGEQKDDFNRRLTALEEQENRNALELERMRSENRAEFKSLSARANAASQVRKAYGSSKGDRLGTLKDKA